MNNIVVKFTAQEKRHEEKFQIFKIRIFKQQDSERLVENQT